MSSNEFSIDIRTGRLLSRQLTLMVIVLVGLVGLAVFLSGSNIKVVDSNSVVPPIETVSVPASWMIEGALTEACTCSVPCTCNFGEGPSPHSYCYALYSYEIRKGQYNDIKLDGLHFGATDLKAGRTLFIDERANESQREALRVIIARVIERSTADASEKEAKEIGKEMRYVTIEQEYDGRSNHLEVKGIGEFSATYIMGLDKSQPLIVRNNTTWRIHDAIKAKTSDFRVKVGKDSINTKSTNSNQGDFEYSDKTNFGSSGGQSCGSAMISTSRSKKGEKMCGM